jgi:predicted esterase
MASGDLGFIHKFIASKNNKTGLTLLLLHGTGGDENDLIPIAQQIALNANVLSPRGRVLENGMNRYFRRLSEGVFDLEDLKFRTDELAEFVIAASKKYGFDQKKLIAVGLSNGANIAANMLLFRPETLSGAILFRPMLIPVFPQVPNDPKYLASKWIFISSGKWDQIVSKDSVEDLISVFRKYGATMEIEWVDSGHALTLKDIQIAHDKIQRYLVESYKQR